VLPKTLECPRVQTGLLLRKCCDFGKSLDPPRVKGVTYHGGNRNTFIISIVFLMGFSGM